MSIFDGLAGMLAEVFGSPVTWLPAAGGSATVQSVVRLEPVEVTAEDGHAVLDLGPTWKVPMTADPGISRGDRIRHDGRTYEVISRQPTRSPAEDRFLVFDLEEVDP